MSERPAADGRGSVRVVAVIQARMGSTRLPGKVLLPIGGRSVLAHVVARLRRVPELDAVVVATTRRHIDAPVVEECQRLEVPCVRGPEQDVLRRYVMAARRHAADIVVRATADNPAVDPESVGRIVAALRQSGCDYVSEDGLPKGGCAEAFTRRALWRAAALARESRHREHVTSIMKEPGAPFRNIFLDAPDAVHRPKVNLSVDTEQDYRFVRWVLEEGSGNALNTTLEQILALLGDGKSDQPGAWGNPCLPDLSLLSHPWPDPFLNRSVES